MYYHHQTILNLKNSSWDELIQEDFFLEDCVNSRKQNISIYSQGMWYLTALQHIFFPHLCEMLDQFSNVSSVHQT